MMDRDGLTAWALKNGFRIIAGHPSLTKPSAPAQAILRFVFKSTVVALEIKKPAGKWDVFTSTAYKDITLDPETNRPIGLGLEKIPSISMLIQQNKDAQVFGSLK